MVYGVWEGDVGEGRTDVAGERRRDVAGVAGEGGASKSPERKKKWDGAEMTRKKKARVFKFNDSDGPVFVGIPSESLNLNQLAVHENFHAV